MSEKLIQELEGFLIPFALDRFDFSKYNINMPFAKMAQSMAKSMTGNWVNEYVTWLVRSFIRCILNVEGKMKLKDIAAVIVAEANYMANVGPYGPFTQNFGRTGGSDRSSNESLAEGEVHCWMLYLQDNDKLPGVYERFTGIYRTN